MAGEWTTSLLGEITNNFDGKRKPVKEADRRPGPYPYYGASGIVDYVEDYLFDGEYLLIAEDGENLRTRQTPIAFLAKGRFWVNNHAHIVTGNEKADTRFLMYALQNADINGYLTGAVMPKLTQGNMNRIRIDHPCISEQRAITSILGALDDKIDLNHRMNATLETMARALFKDWFVDFGPTRAKMEGREPYLAPDLWALFPDRLDDDGKPEGWSMGTISDICTLVVNGGTPNRSTAAYWMDGDVRWFKTGELSDSFVLDSQEKITQRGVAESSAKILPRDAVIMAIYAAPTVGRLGIFTAPSAFNQACTGMVAKPEIGPWFLYLALFFGRDWFNDRANGAAQQNISKRIVEGYAVQIAGRNVFAAFNGLVTPLFKSVRSNVEQSQTLAQTRDLLLPKLMSGEIRVRDAERMVEDVV